MLTAASWEYPNGSGLECNVVSSDDSANFLAFLQALRTDPVGQNLILSAAVGMKPFNGSDGKPMTDVSAFAKVFDHIGSHSFTNPTGIPSKTTKSYNGIRRLWTLVNYCRPECSAG